MSRQPDDRLFRTGEKETLCILHVMTSISGVVIYFVSPGMKSEIEKLHGSLILGHWLYLSTWLFTKFASSSAFMCVLVFMSSKYPVEYRNSFVAISATLSNIAAVFAPQVYILVRMDYSNSSTTPFKGNGCPRRNVPIVFTIHSSSSVSYNIYSKKYIAILLINIKGPFVEFIRRVGKL